MEGLRYCFQGRNQEDASSKDPAEEPDPAHLFLTETYQYDLPARLIAQKPLRKRDQSRLMVLSRGSGSFQHRSFLEIREFLREGDLVVVNNSKVFPARIMGQKSTGGSVELLLLQPSGQEETPWEGVDRSDRPYTEWDCLIRSSRRPGKGQLLRLPHGAHGEITGGSENGIWQVRFHTKGMEFFKYLDRFGQTPLPPYIKRKQDRGMPTDSVLDRVRYQTVFARSMGSVAAPTAGLHFSEEICRNLQAQKIAFVEVTLHVGQATFLPVRAPDIRNHSVWPERFHMAAAAADAIQGAMTEGRRIVAVGTTVVRCLESLFAQRGKIEPCSGWADLYIIPGFRFRVVDALLTNFHLPGSSLLMLVSAFAGKKHILKAYKEAIHHEYRFFSYGDCMLVR